MIYAFLADGFEEVEALAPVDMLRRAGVNVLTVGVTGEAVRGSHGIVVAADITAKEMDMAGAEMLVLPGGMPGTLNLERSEKVIACVKSCYENGKLTAAICAAPSILGHLGILCGRNATCFPGFENELKGANYTAAHVEIDEHVITAKGAGCSIEFGHAIVSFALDRAAADSVIEAMQCL